MELGAAHPRLCGAEKRVEFRCGPMLYCDFAFYHTLVRYLGEEKIEELDLNGAAC